LCFPSKSLAGMSSFFAWLGMISFVVILVAMPIRTPQHSTTHQIFFETHNRTQWSNQGLVFCWHCWPLTGVLLDTNLPVSITSWAALKECHWNFLDSRSNSGGHWCCKSCSKGYVVIYHLYLNVRVHSKHCPCVLCLRPRRYYDFSSPSLEHFLSRLSAIML
jgi:hypothetical protein